MTQCKQIRKLLSSYLDGAMTGVEMHRISRHLEGCADCHSEYAGLKNTLELVGSAGRRAAPPDLRLRLRVAISHERARLQRPLWQRLPLRLENLFNTFMLPATTGLVSATIVFGLLGGFFSVPALTSSNDVPTLLYTPPHLTSTSFADGQVTGHFDGPVTVEAYVGPDGRVEDYRIISGPQESPSLKLQLDNALIFAHFEPAKAFGQPSAGTVVISFSHVNVQG